MKRLMEMKKQAMIDKDTVTKICLEMILDLAQKKAKSEKREVEENDITFGAYSMKKILLDELETSKEKENVEKQLKVAEQFVPKELTEEEVREFIKFRFDVNYTSKDKKTMGLLIKEVKGLTEFRFDAKRVSELVKEFIEA